MNHLIPSIGALAAIVLPCSAQLVINEVDADQPGTDTAEFLELYDGGGGATSLDGYVLVFFNGSSDTSYAAYDLDGYSTDANGFFVAGNAGVPGATLILGSNGIQNGADGVALYTGNDTDFPGGTAATTTNLVDAIVYGTNDSDDTGLLTALGLTTQYNELEGGGNGSVSRLPDGGATIEIAAPSPGAANPVPAGALTVSLDVSTMSEDGSVFITGTVTTPANVSGDLEVTVSLDDASEAQTANAFIFDGTDSGTFIITAVDDAWQDGDQTVTVTVEAPTYDPDSTTFTVTDDDTGFLVIINEVYNSISGIESDANGDGTPDEDDEFIEIINVSGGPLDLSGATLADASFDRHYFPVGTVLEDGCALLVFAGGDIPEGSTAAFGNTPVQIALSNPSFPGLSLTDSGDTVTLIDTTGSVSGTFGAELHSVTLPDQSSELAASSITTSTDADASSGYILHTATVGGNPYSPGTSPDGTAYCPLTTPLTVSISGGPYTEEDGYIEAAGTVSIPASLPGDLYVYLTSSDPGELDLSLISPVTILAGQTFANFDLQFIDDVQVDGTQTVTVTAHAIGYLNGETTVDVEDAGDTPTFTDLVINEVDADTDGTDALEFIELYNNTASLQSLDGLVLVLFNGSDDASYDAIDLSGYSIPANGFFVVGSASVANVDLAYFTTNGLQNGADAVALIAGNVADFPNDTAVTSISGTLVDALVYDTNDGDNTVLLGALTPAGSQINEDGGGDKDFESISRVPDGGAAFDTSVYVTQAPTPGATNVASGPVDFASWATANGIDGEAFGDDFDKDGIPNGVEYAIDGLDPTAPDNLADAFDGSTLSFTKRAVAVANGDVTYAIEESDDLGITDAWEEVLSYDTNDATTIAYTLPGGATRIFARLKIEELAIAF